MWIKGHSRSQKVAPIDRSYTIYYWYAIVTIFELSDVEEYRDLEIYVRALSRSLKMVPFVSFDTFFIRIPQQLRRIFSRFDTVHERDSHT